MRFSQVALFRRLCLIVVLFALLLTCVGCSSLSSGPSSDDATASAQASGCRGGLVAVDVTRYPTVSGVTSIADLATPDPKPATPEVAGPLCVIELVKVTLDKSYAKTDINVQPDTVTFGGIKITVVGGTSLEKATWLPDQSPNSKQGVLSLLFQTPSPSTVKVNITGLA